MTKQILTLLIFIICQKFYSQEKTWMLAYEYEKNNEKAYNNSNEILIRQTKDSIFHYVLNKDYKKPISAFNYNIDKDTLNIKLDIEEYLKGVINKDTLKVYKNGKIKGVFTKLKNNKIKLKKLKKTLYKNKFIIEPTELYNPYNDKSIPEILKFTQNNAIAPNEIKTEVIDINGYIFLKLYAGNQKKCLPVLKVTKKCIKVFTPEIKKTFSLFKVSEIKK
ncbi:hypothetical protein PG911_13885 [Tenacibaculum ovolyticum]|uniref:hypothetical protein n=1 Tax=Tenacibaculum ovolyticum TaxID=104270 RepID=UPI00048FD0E0|nr:hypothetical protein [Tenacibaculum ovolyticum]WBX75737.1 hypothetical protein PG911_13885 [Tenacibaculum ovolyticum]